MITELAWFYVGGLTLLFFFWVYGIVSFARDVRRKLLPAIRQYRARRAAESEEESDLEAQEDERHQLH